MNNIHGTNWNICKETRHILTLCRHARFGKVIDEDMDLIIDIGLLPIEVIESEIIKKSKWWKLPSNDDLYYCFIKCIKTDSYKGR